MKEKLTTRKERRQEAEAKAEKGGQTIPYPTIEELRAEDEETEPAVLLTVRDQAGEVVRRIPGSRDRGLHRVAWDLRYPSSAPINLADDGQGPLVLAGEYSVELSKVVDGVTTTLVEPTRFDVVDLGGATFEPENREEILAFQRQVAKLQRAVGGAVRLTDETRARLDYLRKAVRQTPAASPELLTQIQQLTSRLNVIRTKLSGDRTLSRLQEPVPPSIHDRIRSVVGSQWNVTSPPTQTQRDAYRYAGQEFAQVLTDLRQLIRQDLAAVEQQLETVGAPWTPGRILDWTIDGGTP